MAGPIQVTQARLSAYVIRRVQGIGPPGPVATPTIANISGLQPALDAKADNSALAGYLNGKADSGSNSDITAISGLTTPLAVTMGGTGAASIAGALAALGLVGVTLPFAGTMAPAGTLLCFGQAVSRATYAALYAVIGATYGAGNGTTTFNLPDLRARAIFGTDSMGGTASGRITSAVSGVTATSLGATGGSQLEPPHQHITPVGFDINGNIYGAALSDGTGKPLYGSGVTSATTRLTRSGGTFDTANTIVGLTDTAVYSVAGSANVPPAMIMNYIIVTGV